MAESVYPALTGGICYNGQWIKLPLPFSWTAMQAAHGDREITELSIGHGHDGQPLSGCNEAVNEFLDFSVQQVTDTGLKIIQFDGVTE